MTDAIAIPAAATRKSSDLYIFFIVLTAAAGGFIMTYDLVLMSGAILFLEPYFKLTPKQVGFAMTSATWGVFAGLLTAGWLADSISRKWTLFIAAVLFMISTIGTALARGYIEWNFHRIIGGVGCGLAMMVSPMYIAEIAPARRRGLMVSCNQMAAMIGAFLAIVVCWYLSKMEGIVHWRWMFASVGPPVLVFVVSLLFIPRSPRWLISKGRLEEARRVLTMIDGPEHADRELADINRSSHQEVGGIRELFQPGIRAALFIGIALAAYQQFCGVSTLSLYAPSIFKAAGIGTESDAIFQTIILRTWNTCTTVFAMLMVDRLGRRPLLLWGIFGMALGQIIMGVSIQMKLPPQALLIAMFLGEGSYTISLAPLTWLIMSEIFPTRVRALGMMVAVLVLQGSAYLVNILFPQIIAYSRDQLQIEGLAYWIFAAICLSAWVFSYYKVPETKHKTLEEITDSLGGKKGDAGLKWTMH